MYKLIIFDLDGPILDSFQAAKDSIFFARKETVRKKLIPAKELPELDEESIVGCWGYPGQLTLAKIFPHLTEKHLEGFVKTWIKNEKKRELKLVKGADEALSQIKKEKYYTGLLTSRSHNLGFHLKNLDLENLFDFIQSWRNPNLKEKKLIHKNHIISPLYKPNPLVFKKIFKWARQRKVFPENTMLVDDTLVGLNTAKFAEISFLGVCTGPLNSKEKWQRYGNLPGKYVIKSIAELPEWLKENMRP